MDNFIRFPNLLIDSQDKYLIQNYKWHLNKGYLRHYLDKACVIYLHRLILKITDPKIQVDHINGNVMDNRRSNLRIATHAQNLQNQKVQKNNKSGYKGVSYRENGKKYRAQIMNNRKYYFLGSYKTAKEAAFAYNNAALKLNNEFARINIL